MNGWQRSDTIKGNGAVWQNAILGISVFEDTSEGTRQWYAWMGTPDDHDNAGQTGSFPTRDEAVADLIERTRWPLTD